MPFQGENPRIPANEVDSMFVDRWSPRAFLPEPIPACHLDSLFEAVRWAPSCFNEQPWTFHYASSPASKSRFLSALFEKNRLWAAKAPLIMFLVASKQFSSTDKPNRHAPFDCGTAWLSLALQARKLGYYAHAMAGFSQKKVFEILSLDAEKNEVMAAIVVGRLGDPNTLPSDLKQMEVPNQRKTSSEIAIPC
jgi:nitroreductase